MQPYLFPYFGYFQLLFCADVFVIYDDANYIKQGYINRNTIMSGGRPLRFTIPVANGSSNKQIKDVTFLPGGEKVLRTIRQSYSKAPNFDAIYPLISEVLSDSGNRSVTEVCENGMRLVSGYLGLSAEIVRSSEINYDRSEGASKKLVSICKALDANAYVNSIGGKELYARSQFAPEGVRLQFLKPTMLVYDQPGTEFVPNLSIIDVLMQCDRPRILEAVPRYEMVDAS